jgi:hypothetical protein
MPRLKMLDEVHYDIPQDASHPNLYTLGRISEHNVVMVCLPAGQIGTSSARRGGRPDDGKVFINTAYSNCWHRRWYPTRRDGHTAWGCGGQLATHGTGWRGLI